MFIFHPEGYSACRLFFIEALEFQMVGLSLWWLRQDFLVTLLEGHAVPQPLLIHSPSEEAKLMCNIWVILQPLDDCKRMACSRRGVEEVGKWNAECGTPVITIGQQQSRSAFPTPSFSCSSSSFSQLPRLVTKSTL